MQNNLHDHLIERLNRFGLESLETYNILISQDPRYPKLYNLKYSALSPKDALIVQACRGAVVECDDFGHFNLVAYAFDRFFNIGEPECAALDWDSVVAYEKYDGSLIKLFHYEGKWVVSTSGSVGGRGEVDSTGITFEELFWRTFDACGYSVYDLDEDGVYIWELCTANNRIVVKYPRDFIRLIGLRDRSRGFSEVKIGLLRSCFDVAVEFGSNNLEEITRVANGLDGSKGEGFVLCDKRGNRAKVKGSSYVQMHRARGNGKPDFVSLWKNDDLQEFLTFFPEYTEEFDELVQKITGCSIICDEFLAENENLTQKEFAAKALSEQKELAPALFAIRANKVSDLENWLLQASDKTVASLLGLR
jgi:RNA ligase